MLNMVSERPSFHVEFECSSQRREHSKEKRVYPDSLGHKSILRMGFGGTVYMISETLKIKLLGHESETVNEFNNLIVSVDIACTNDCYFFEHVLIE